MQSNILYSKSQFTDGLYKVYPESNAICFLSSKRHRVETGRATAKGDWVFQWFQIQFALSSGSVRIAVSVNFLLVLESQCAVDKTIE